MKKLLALIITLVLAVNLEAQKVKRPDSYNFTRGLEALQNRNSDEALDYFHKEIDEHPNNGYAYVWLARLYEQQSQYGRALTAADKSIKLLPKKDKQYVGFAYATRAFIHFRLENIDKALDDYTSAIKQNPEDYDSYDKRAQLYFEQKKYDLADLGYKKLIELDRGSVMGYMGIGRSANAQKKYEKAIEQFNYVVKLAPEYPSGYSFRAESYAGLKQYAKAADDIVKALDINGDDKAFYWMQEVADSSFNDMATKLKVQATKNPNNGYWKFCLGIIHERSEQYRKAIGYYKEAFSKDGNPLIASRICECYDKLGDYDMALEYIDKALQLDSTSYADINTRANVLDNAGRTKEAIVEISKCIEKHPEYYSGYYRRGWMKDHSGDIEGAIEDYTMAIAIKPEYAYTYLNRGNLYRILGKADLARADFEEVIKRDTIPGDDNTAHYAYYYLGQKDKAIDFMDKALKENDKGNYYDAACLYSIMGETDKAVSYLRKALETGYRCFAHIERDRDLNNIRETDSFKELIKEYQDKHKSEVESNGADNGEYEEVTTEIPFSKEGGVCKVKCTINSLPLHFIFDTGASDVSLSNVEAAFMMKNDYLKNTDVIGRQNFMNANGEISEGTVINLKSVNFGGFHLDDIKASVVKNQSAPLLLGQSVLARLGKIEIDNDKRVIKITYKKQK